jgi:hypothetical protein
MTQSEIINKIMADPKFALGFALDNNPSGVVSALITKGQPVTDANSAYNLLLSCLTSGDGHQLQFVKDIYGQVPYIDNSGNYTAGMRNYFMQNTPATGYPTNLQSKFDFTGLLSGLGAGLTAYSAASLGTGVMTTLNQTNAQGGISTAQPVKKSNTIYWILGGVGLVVIIVAVVISMKKK